MIWKFLIEEATNNSKAMKPLLYKENIYPALTGSKTPTSKFRESEEVRWGINCP
jgi:hypothetical protein